MTVISEQQESQSPQNKEASKQQSINFSYFPLGYKTSACQWWKSLTPAATERMVISFIPHIQGYSRPGLTDVLNSTLDSSLPKSAGDPYGPRYLSSKLIALSGVDRAINELSVERTGEDVEQNLVMLHGYGAGLGFFYKNIEELSRSKAWKIFAIDMLGMGRSSRPPFKIHAKDQAGMITEAENWFTDSLEEWRKIKKLEKFTLLGHSMGGYFAVAYALKYPGRLNKLILVSPVGIPENPHATSEDFPEPESSTLAQEFTQDQNETSGIEGTKKSDDLNREGSDKMTSENPVLKKSAKPSSKKLPKWLIYLWDANISPFSIIRWAGPLGPRFVSGWSSRRFAHLPAEESEALHQYAYSLFRQPGSGEYALPYILAPGAFARSPLINRIHKVGRQELPTKFRDKNENTTSPRKETGIPILFMYGENDWMDVAAGYAAEQRLNEERARVIETASNEERMRENGSTKVIIVKNAGHHLYLDNWKEFNEIIRNEMEETRLRDRHDQAPLLND
ncbi:putative cardiolipin-specific deacylase, mitochondrial [Golovinomyces cichoracearum]|uniref:Putative cardiolipin-specific deacylase, mitochondrial n=1 Tax=Golovinomyces cichoracearum TaxID=62708 RepID=A0A420J6D4_9PEZI|nr:putative cardiolipin-specific deacylase, mitochondrial [Golovinomyces cichoracearum]